MNQKISVAIWFPVILMLAFFVGFLAWAKATFNWPFDQEYIPVPKAENRVSDVSEVEDWKTYRNEGYGFEFKYPNDWVEHKNGIIFGIRPPRRPENYIRDGLYISLTRERIGEGKTIQEYFRGQQGTELISYVPFDNLDPSKTFQIRGVTFFEFIIPGVIDTRHTFFVRDNYIYELYKPEDLSYTEYYSKDELLNVYNQILSTFKFIEPQSP